MLEALLPLAGLAALGVVAFLWHGVRLQRMTRERLTDCGLRIADRGLAEESAIRNPQSAIPQRPFPRRRRLFPWLAAAAVGTCLYLLTGIQPTYVAALALICGLLGSQVEAFLASQQTLKMETQLSDALDMMVGALRAGASVLSALANAAEEAPAPLRPQLEEVLGRIRYGDDPQAVLRGLVARVPLESVRLFAAALSVHWEVGGSLAPTLATVGRTIRDRLAIARRIGSLTAEARFSVGAVLLVTYFIALLMWRTDPQRMTEFLNTMIGQALVTAVVVLQALGIVWSTLLSRLKF